MRPLIGMPTSLDDRGRWHPGRTYHYLDAAYASAIDAAGGQPILLPPQRDIAGLVERLDGLLLPGGDDFEPDHPYPDSVSFDLVSEAQLSFDLALVRIALERDLPVLGICYGMQLLAIEHGATLCFDLATDRPEACVHQLPESEGRHAVEILPGSLLASLFGDQTLHVNSLHHQAVDTAGPRLRVSAQAPDGVIEAIECDDYRFALGVQWHPEKLGGHLRNDLFRGFVTACRDASPRFIRGDSEGLSRK